MTITFGELKRRIEEFSGIKLTFDYNGLFFRNDKIIYHIGYENQLLILTNNIDNSKMSFDTIDGLMNALQKIFE